MSDLFIHVNSPYNFNTLSSRQVIRIKKIIHYGILSWYNTKLSVTVNKEMYGHQLGELAFRSWGMKGLNPDPFPQFSKLSSFHCSPGLLFSIMIKTAVKWNLLSLDGSVSLNLQQV